MAEILVPMVSIPPTKIGFRSENAQCSYYPEIPMTSEEVNLISKVMERCELAQKNTRIRKVVQGGHSLFEILVASSTGFDTDPPVRVTEEEGALVRFRLVRGDHSRELSQICKALFRAYQYSPCPKKGFFGIICGVFGVEMPLLSLRRRSSGLLIGARVWKVLLGSLNHPETHMALGLSGKVLLA